MLYRALNVKFKQNEKSIPQDLCRGNVTDEDIIRVIQQYKLVQTDGVLDRNEANQFFICVCERKVFGKRERGGERE